MRGNPKIPARIHVRAAEEHLARYARFRDITKGMRHSTAEVVLALDLDSVPHAVGAESLVTTLPAAILKACRSEFRLRALRGPGAIRYEYPGGIEHGRYRPLRAPMKGQHDLDIVYRATKNWIVLSLPVLSH